MEPVIRVRDLRKSFKETRAIDGLSFEVNAGEIFGLVGPDGAGKSTTLRILCGILGADGGRIEAAGTDVLSDPEAVKPHIGYMPQRFSLYGDLTVQENLRFFADMYFVPKKERPGRMRELYEFSRLGRFTDRRAANLSGGMQKKLALACNLMHRPRLLLLDEPTTGVDPVSRRELWELVYRLVEDGLTVLVSTPYMDEAERCHRVGLIHEGRMLLADEPSRIRDKMRQAVFECVGGDVREIAGALDGLDAVASAYPVGSSVHVVLREDVADPDAAAEAIRAEGIGAGSVRRIRPSFEDVFISLLESRQ